MARRLHISAREMPGELAGPQGRAQARARRHVARMVITFVIGKLTHFPSVSALLQKCIYVACYIFHIYI